MSRLLLFVWLYLIAAFAVMLGVQVFARCTGRHCKPLFCWFDIWIGVYWDAKGRKLYVFPLPTLGVVLDCGRGLMYTDIRRFVPGVGWAVFREYRLTGVPVGTHEMRGDQSPSVREAVHASPVMRSIRSLHPAMTVAEAMGLWTNRKAA